MSRDLGSSHTGGINSATASLTGNLNSTDYQNGFLSALRHASMMNSGAGVTSTTLNSFSQAMYPGEHQFIANMNQLHLNPVGNEPFKEMLSRRDNEIERLKLKLLFFEQQSQFKENYFKPSQVELLEQEARSKLQSYAEIQNLDALLNKKEYDIKQMKIQHEEQTVKLEKEINKFKKLASEKEEELLSERNKCGNLQKDLERIRKQVNDMNHYMKELPTKDELDEAERRVAEVRNENDGLKTRMAELDKKLIKAKMFAKEKNAEINEFKDKIEKLEMERDKVRVEFVNYKEATQSVGELIERCEENASLRGELDCAHKMIASLQDKMKSQQAKFESQIGELKEKIKWEQNDCQSMRGELNQKERQIEQMKDTINELLSNIESLKNESIKMNDTLNSYQVLASADSFKMFKLMFKELNVCIKDLDCLVRNCIDIYDGKQIDICSLLGTPTRNKSDFVDLTNNETIISLMNTDFLLRKTNELKNMRKMLDEVKKAITDQYAEKIGGNISCIMQ